jgi:hypothetical protein
VSILLTPKLESCWEAWPRYGLVSDIQAHASQMTENRGLTQSQSDSVGSSPTIHESPNPNRICRDWSTRHHRGTVDKAWIGQSCCPGTIEKALAQILLKDKN